MRLTDTSLTFPSVENLSWRYRISDDPASDFKGISRYVTTYDTMDDGETQHTADVVPQVGRLGDFLQSFVLTLGELDKLPDFVRMVFSSHPPSFEQIKFLAKAVYREDKDVFVNVKEAKKSTADSKRYDKRWTRLTSYHDGTFRGILSVFYETDYKPYNVMGSLALTLQVADALELHDGAIVDELAKWDCWKDCDRDTVRDYLDCYRWIKRWCEAMSTIKWIRDVSQKRTERYSQC